MKKKSPWVLLCMIAFGNVTAQDTLSLKLQNALDATAKNNAEILLATLEQEEASAKFNQSNAVFLPQLNLSYTAMVTNNPLNAFGFKLQQQSVTPSDFNPELLNNPAAAQNYMTRVEWSQPIINMDMVYQRRAASQQIDVYAYKARRTKEYMLFEVKKAYAQLQLSRQAVTVLAEALYTLRSIHEAVKNYCDKGLVQKSDVLLAEVQLLSIESKLADAKSNVRNASDYISLLMGTKSRPLYDVEALELVDQAEVADELPEDRADFGALKSALSAQEMMINSSRLSYLPKLNAFASYTINDKAAFGFGSNAYLAGAQLSWSLFNGTSVRHRIVGQRIAYARLEQQLSYQKEQGRLELSKTMRQLQDTRYYLQQHEASVKQATEALRILRNRFQLGLASTNDVLQSQSVLSEQTLHQAEAIFRHNTTLAYLHFLTSDSKK